jgi:hypothetical protein
MLSSGPYEQTKSVVPHLRRSTACLWTQPFRAGLIFGAGPLGLDCKHRYPMFIHLSGRAQPEKIGHAG